MSWTQDQIDRLRTKMSLARRAGEWLTAPEASMVLGLIAFWRRMTVRTSWQGPADGMLPTIRHVRSQGVRGVIVECRRPGCDNRRKLAFGDLRLPEDVVFVEIAKHRGFRCHRCGCRDVQIVADHPNPLGPAPGGVEPGQPLR